MKYIAALKDRELEIEVQARDDGLFDDVVQGAELHVACRRRGREVQDLRGVAPGAVGGHGQ